MAICEVIKYEGDNNTLVWKHPVEDFNTLTQLIVHESQEAVFFRNGEALDTFPAGRRTLETQNIPLLKNALHLPTGGITPFHCEVYFINKTIALNMKWGIPSQAEVLDPQFNILINVSASGAMGIQVGDSRKFLTKLIGTESTISTETLTGYFKDAIATRVKSDLVTIMSEVGFVVINKRLSDLSEAIKGHLEGEMNEFGVKLVNFYLSTIQIPDKDKEMIKEALAIASSRSIQGINWVDEQIAEISKIYAGNEGTQNSPAGMLAQAPMAFAFGNMLKKQAEPLLKDSFSSTPLAFGSHEKATPVVNTPFMQSPPPLTPKSTSTQPTDSYCASCGKPLTLDANFCPFCGQKQISKVACPQCGRVFKDGEIFCPGCGNRKE